ncbi:MAG: AbrB/MazE/SpoVT family DNA-binding domain-containing protein [Pygmaiobacter sp.]
MRETGITRHLDDMGRIVLPVELRRKMNLSDGTALEIFTEGERIILQKQINACAFCGTETDLQQFKNQNVCANCRKELKGE